MPSTIPAGVDPELGFGGGYLIRFIVFSCGKFLKTIACYREYYCLRKHCPAAPWIGGSGYGHICEQNKENCVSFTFMYNFPLKLVILN